MRYLLYIIAVILIIAGVIEYIGFSTGGFINILLVIAIVAIIIKAFQVSFAK